MIRLSASAVGRISMRSQLDGTLAAGTELRLRASAVYVSRFSQSATTVGRVVATMEPGSFATYARGYSDQFGASDAAAILLDRASSEPISVSDTSIVSVQAVVVDVGRASDTKILLTNKPFYDTVVSTDAAQILLMKSEADGAALADSLATLFGAGYSDVGAVSDAGAARNQGYCDPTYLAEDFVGESVTF